MKTQDDPYGLITSRFASEDARSSRLPSAARTAEDVQLTLQQFFEAEVRNPNTRRAYRLGAKDFFVYLSTRHHVHAMDAITALHVGAWLDDMEHRRLSLPTIKQRLAGLRMMFGALVREQILRFNPVTVVKGPSHTVAKGKTILPTGPSRCSERNRCERQARNRSRTPQKDQIVATHTVTNATSGILATQVLSTGTTRALGHE